MPIIFDGTFWSETVIDAWLEWLWTAGWKGNESREAGPTFYTYVRMLCIP